MILEEPDLSLADAQTPNPQGGWLATALFVMVVCYFWIGIAPMPDPQAGSPAAYGESSNQFNQLIVIAMTALVLALLVFHPGRILALKVYAPLLVLFAWIAVTILFSATPDSALRRTLYSVLVCICASAILLLPRDNAQFAKMMGTCLLLAVGLSYIGVLFFPGRAIHQASDFAEQALAGDWRGHLGHKNAAAGAMAFAVFFGLYLIRAGSFWRGMILTVLAGVFLFNSGGKTSAALLPAILILTWMFERAGWLRYGLVIGTLALVNFVILSVTASPAMRDFVSGLGVDATFTDRSSIWSLALSAIEMRPFTGYGFQSFWQTEALYYGNHSVSTWAVTAANAHNSYLDQLINGGVPLLVLVVGWIVVLPIRHAGMALKRGNDKNTTRLFIRIWMFGLFMSCFESPFFNNYGPIWFTMLIAVFGLHLQARAVLLEKTVPDAAQLQPALS